MSAGGGGGSGTVVGSLVREEDGVWQDKEIRFDTSLRDLAMRRGEVEIDSINSVEDTKGNNGERGSFQVTNLRLLWTSHRNFHVNLSIGYACVHSISIRVVESRSRSGRAQALYLMTKQRGQRFEFIFTSLVRESPRLFTTVQSVFRAYETSKLYRDLKLRGALVKGGRLSRLPEEEVMERVEGVWNLSSEQGNIGTLFVTSVRVVWFATLANNFNVSAPWTTVKAIKQRDSRFGRALVIEICARAGGYVLGFRVDPASKQDALFKSLSALHEAKYSNPTLGVRFSVEEKPPDPESAKIAPIAEDVDIVDDETAAGDALAAYMVGTEADATGRIAFDPYLGLAVEPIPGDYSTEKLWAVL